MLSVTAGALSEAGRKAGLRHVFLFFFLITLSGAYSRNLRHVTQLLLVLHEEGLVCQVVP